MRIKTFFFVLSFGILFFFSLAFFKAQEQTSFQSLVTETNKQIHNFKDKLKNAEEKRLEADEKHLLFLGFTDHPRLYPKNIWTNTTLPVIVTLLFKGEEDMGIGFAKNSAHMANNHAVLIYDVGLSSSGLHSVAAHCNTSQCQIVRFDLKVFPSHVQDDPVHTVKALVIQDALNKAGSVLYLDNNLRIISDIEPLLESKPVGSFVTRRPVTSLTHPNMMTYFKTKVESFLFLPMIDTNRLLLWNTIDVHRQIMLPWIQCVLTPECVHPIGAQSQGCRFDKKPRYRYSGCHGYDASALNVVLGLAYHLDETNYTFPFQDTFFLLSSATENGTVS